MRNPVLALDLRLSGRRGRFLWLRFGYGLWLTILLGVSGSLWLEWPVAPPPGWKAHETACLFMQIFLVQHFLILTVAVPAYFCGAITEEKENGTLVLLMTTETSPWGIVLGKFASRLAQVMGLMIVGLPIFCLVGMYFNLITWVTVLAFIGLSLVIAFGLGGFSLWQSVRAAETRIAAVRIYFVLAVVLVLSLAYYHLGVPFLIQVFWRHPPICHALVASGQALLHFDPVSILEPTWNPPELERMRQTLLVPCASWFAVGLIFSIWSALILRKAALHPLDAQQDRRGQGPKREPVPEDQPICWRETLRRRHWPHWIAAAVLAVAATEAHHQVIYEENLWLLTPIWAVAAALVSLPVILRASGSITGERNRKTWESILATPFEGWQLVVEKRRGALLRYTPYFVAFVIPALIVPSIMGFKAVLWALTMLLLWGMVVFYMASTGVWCSAFSTSSWRSVVATIGRGFGFFLAIATMVGLFYLAVACLFSPIISVIVNFTGSEEFAESSLLVIGIAGSCYLAWRLYKAADECVWLAQTWIETHERYGRSFTRSLSRALKKAQARYAEELAQKSAQASANGQPSEPQQKPMAASPEASAS
ncbi:MAG: ABC transporter permease subunit [Gemmatales bacterium]|nr:ABC transporter permease subunit [Gemmatales bacterium]MDW8387112.1 ABC transporter permease subunit [Gemmatales bacterium]